MSDPEVYDESTDCEDSEDSDSTGSLAEFIVPDDEEEVEEGHDEDDDDEEEDEKDEEGVPVAVDEAPMAVLIETDEEAEIRRQYTEDMERQGSILIGGVRRSMRKTKGVAPSVYVDEHFVELMTEDTTPEEIQQLAESETSEEEDDDEEATSEDESEEEFEPPPRRIAKRKRA